MLPVIFLLLETYFQFCSNKFSNLHRKATFARLCHWSMDVRIVFRDTGEESQQLLYTLCCSKSWDRIRQFLIFIFRLKSSQSMIVRKPFSFEWINLRQKYFYQRMYYTYAYTNTTKYRQPDNFVFCK